MYKRVKTQVVVIGGGPSGYSAAFRCSDLGLETILVERYPVLGGVCLNVGCIPSKSLLHISKIINEIEIFKKNKIFSCIPEIDLNQLKVWKNKVIEKLNAGLLRMSKDRKIRIINGTGKFHSSNEVIVKTKEEKILLNFDNAIIAVGSRPAKLDFLNYKDNRIWDSTDALKLKFIPKKMLIIGGGIIGLEIGTVYQSFGSKIDIVEITDKLIPEIDEDVVKVFLRDFSKKVNLIFKSKVTNIIPERNGILVFIEDENGNCQKKYYDAVLVSIGRVSNGDLINADKIGIQLDQFNLFSTDNQMKTNIDHIYAIGDVVGFPMLAHKGIHQGHIAAEVISGLKYYFNPIVIPSIAYTEPEVAWVGLSEKEAKKIGINFEVSIFPWIASGRALSSNISNGMTKLILNKETNKIIGGSIVGSHAGELLGEISLAIEMGCDIEDIALTIHAHPTLYETIGMAAEILTGSITDLPNLKSKNSFLNKKQF